MTFYFRSCTRWHTINHTVSVPKHKKKKTQERKNIKPVLYPTAKQSRKELIVTRKLYLLCSYHFLLPVFFFQFSLFLAVAISAYYHCCFYCYYNHYYCQYYCHYCCCFLFLTILFFFFWILIVLFDCLLMFIRITAKNGLRAKWKKKEKIKAKVWQSFTKECKGNKRRRYWGWAQRIGSPVEKMPLIT